MHVLTKIFAVLVSLLAVAMVPLVVVYAYNESNFKTRFLEAEARSALAARALQAAEASAGTTESRLAAESSNLEKQIARLEAERNGAKADANQLRLQLATAEGTQQTVVADIGVIKAALEAGRQLTESLVSEVRELRTNAVAMARQNVELDEALREKTSQLDVAEQARRALAEELSRIKDEHGKALTKLSQYVASVGELSVRAGALRDSGLIPDISLTANVIRVERSSGQVLVEIDAGSRDGVKDGWSLNIAHNGTFVAKIKIIDVDINRSTGIVSLESKERGMVQVGHTVYAVAGQD